MEHKKRRGNPVIMIAILLLVLVFLFSGLQILESTVFHKDPGTGQQGQSKTIVRNGIEYFPRQDITVILLAGIDEDGPVQASDSYNNSGEADMVSLLIFDERAEKLNVLSLNRDTMLEIPILGIGGKKAGTIQGQLALAHTYGTGLEDSCENLRDTVSDFLYGAAIDYYVALNMDAIGLLNDAVGGVTVTVTDDFSAIDPTIQKGTVTLRGQQAIHFVRTRQGMADQMNVTRMERHREYMKGFLEALRHEQGSTGFITSTYQKVSDYMVTDCSSTVMTTIMDRYGDYLLGDIVTLKGENVKGQQYMEYHVDKDDLDEVILKYLYAPK